MGLHKGVVTLVKLTMLKLGLKFGYVKVYMHVVKILEVIAKQLVNASCGSGEAVLIKDNCCCIIYNI